MTRVLLPILCVLFASAARSADRYIVIVSGASGDAQYAGRYETWRQTLINALVEGMAVDPSHIDVLFDGADEAHEATAGNVRRVLDALRGTMRADDVAMVVLMGHGTFDGIEAFFRRHLGGDA